jgi:hypothetical protein
VAPVGEHFLAALLSESVKALAAQLQQLVALGVAQLLPAHQVVGASLVAGDAVAGKNLAHHALDALGVVIDLGHVLPPGSGGQRPAPGLGGQVWFWAARQASAPAGTPSGVGAGWLQLTRLRVWRSAAPVPLPRQGQQASRPPLSDWAHWRAPCRKSFSWSRKRRMAPFGPGAAPDPPPSREAGTAGPVRIPRDVNGPLLAERLRRHGYEVSRQTGSHMRLSRSP